jgi:hypothetical protein
MAERALDYTVGTCEECGESNRYIGPLHGAKGGPRWCLACGATWYGKYGARRKAGRVAMRAMMAFLKVGGKTKELDRLKLRAECKNCGLDGLFDEGMETFCDGDVPDLTSELLEDTLRLTHPDLHPPERQALAKRVTAALLEFKPFVFPAPPPAPVSDAAPSRWRHDPLPSPATTAPVYPCELCQDEWPSRYCTVCKAEWTRRADAQVEKQRQKERAWYRARRARTKWRRRRPCATCGTPFDPKRNDQQHCRAACRQRAYRRRGVTDKKGSLSELETPVTAGAEARP